MGACQGSWVLNGCIMSAAWSASALPLPLSATTFSGQHHVNTCGLQQMGNMCALLWEMPNAPFSPFNAAMLLYDCSQRQCAQCCLYCFCLDWSVLPGIRLLLHGSTWPEPSRLLMLQEYFKVLARPTNA